MQVLLSQDEMLQLLRHLRRESNFRCCLRAYERAKLSGDEDTIDLAKEELEAAHAYLEESTYKPPPDLEFTSLCIEVANSTSGDAALSPSQIREIIGMFAVEA